jgi:radical SAM-linked protein
MRIRITFAKTHLMRFTSHLDLHRTWERTFRRAGLPLAYTQGYNPHPRINLACALPLGFTGENEIVDVRLEQDIPLIEIESSLHKATPPGIIVHNIVEVEVHAKALQLEVFAADYSIFLLEPIDNLEGNITELLSSSTLPRERRGKKYDLRPFILQLDSSIHESSHKQCIHMRLTTGEGATGRPDEVLNILGVVVEFTQIHRTKIIFKNSNT